MALDAVGDVRAARLARRRARARAMRDLSRRARQVQRRLHGVQRRARVHQARMARGPVPMRLRNAPTKLMKGLGYGKGYRYAHDEDDAYAAGETLPAGRHAGRRRSTRRPIAGSKRASASGSRIARARRVRASRQVTRRTSPMDGQEWVEPIGEYNGDRLDSSPIGDRRPNSRPTRPEVSAAIAPARIVRCSISTACAMICPAWPPRSPSAVSTLDTRRFEALERERKDIQTRTQELQATRNALQQGDRHREGRAARMSRRCCAKWRGLGDELKASSASSSACRRSCATSCSSCRTSRIRSTPVGTLGRRQRRSAPLAARRARSTSPSRITPTSAKARAARFRDGGQARRRALHVPARRSRAAASRARAVHARHAHARARLHRVLHAVHRQRGDAASARRSCRSSRPTCSRCRRAAQDGERRSRCT